MSNSTNSSSRSTAGIQVYNDRYNESCAVWIVTRGHACMENPAECNCWVDGRFNKLEPTSLASVRLTEIYDAIQNLSDNDKRVLFESLEIPQHERICKTCQGQGFIYNGYDARTNTITNIPCPECKPS